MKKAKLTRRANELIDEFDDSARHVNDLLFVFVKRDPEVIENTNLVIDKKRGMHCSHVNMNLSLKLQKKLRIDNE